MRSFNVQVIRLNGDDFLGTAKPVAYKSIGSRTNFGSGEVVQRYVLGYFEDEERLRLLPIEVVGTNFESFRESIQ